MRHRLTARWTSLFVLVTLFVLALPLMAQTPQSAPRDVLVKFRTVNAQNLGEVVRDHDIEAAKWVGGNGVIKFRSRSRGVAAMVRALSARPDVIYAEPDYVVTKLGTPNDTYYSSLWAMPKIGAPAAWNSTTGSRSVVVGVVDTGIDYTHPDLAANVWSTTTGFTLNVNGLSVTCAAGTHGFNAITNTCNPADDESHGTHVSGTIGATGGNGLGVVGVNWTTSIMGLKFLNAQGSGYTSDAIDAIEFAIQAKLTQDVNIRVLSNSWGGGGYSQALYDQINEANSAGILFVAAAGNSGTSNDSRPSYPANYNLPNVLAVAATDSSDKLASWSNYGAKTVALAAPGVNILSTVIVGYASYSGTSMATPHVSGAAALILSAPGCTGLTMAGVRAAILNNVDPVATLAGKVLTGGRLNVSAAIQNCNATAPVVALSVTPSSQTVKQGSSTTYTAVTTPSGATLTSVVVSGLPSGATSSVSGKTLTIRTSRSTPRATYTLQIQGSVNGSVLSTTATLVVK